MKHKTSHEISVWAANMNSAPQTGVDLSPLKRCCHNAFIFSPCWWEREHGRHLMARMHSSDTAGLCGGWGKGARPCCMCVIVQKCVNVYVRFVLVHIRGVMWPCVSPVSVSLQCFMHDTDLMFYYQHQQAQWCGVFSHSDTDRMGVCGSWDVKNKQFVFKRSNIKDLMTFTRSIYKET